MPPISFNQVPANALVPFVYVEFDGSRAVAPAGSFRTLLMGQRLTTGNVAANNPIQINSVAEANLAFGVNSMLSFMTARFRQSAKLSELWCVAVDDVAAGAAAEVELDVTAAPSARGEIALYIAGRRVSVAVDGTEDVNATAVLINTAITAALPHLPALTSVSGSTVTIAHRHKGPIDLDVRFNYQPTDNFPAGFTATLTSTAGTSQPTAANIVEALAAAGEEEFNIIVHPWTDATSIAALEDAVADRWGPVLQTSGLLISSHVSAAGTAAEAIVYGASRNSQFSVVLGHGKIPSQSFEFAAAVAGAIHEPAANDPARPFQTLPVRGVVPPQVRQRWSHVDRESALANGISTFRVDSGGVIRIERLITTYQTAPGGEDDAAYRDANTLFTLDFLRRDWRRYWSTKYGRHKLADDGTRFDEGQPVMTPSLGRAEMIGKFREWEGRGLVEDADAFAAGLVVQRNADNRDRLDFLAPPNLINQLRITAVQIGFIL